MSGGLDFLLDWDSSKPEPAGSSYRWATVTGLDPLRIRFDGETTTASITPAALCQVWVGARVWVQIYGRQMVIMGAAQQPLPETRSLVGVGSNSLDLPQDNNPQSLVASGHFSGPMPVTLSQPLEVDLWFKGWVDIRATNQVRLGIQLGGATQSGPTSYPGGWSNVATVARGDSGTNSTVNTAVVHVFTKLNAGTTQIIPVGSKTLSGTARLLYGALRYKPTAWA